MSLPGLQKLIFVQVARQLYEHPAFAHSSLLRLRRHTQPTEAGRFPHFVSVHGQRHRVPGNLPDCPRVPSLDDAPGDERMLSDGYKI